jgi:hypothetical protein
VKKLSGADWCQLATVSNYAAVALSLILFACLLTLSRWAWLALGALIVCHVVGGYAMGRMIRAMRADSEEMLRELHEETERLLRDG